MHSLRLLEEIVIDSYFEDQNQQTYFPDVLTATQYTAAKQDCQYFVILRHFKKMEAKASSEVRYFSCFLYPMFAKCVHTKMMFVHVLNVKFSFH